MKDRGCAREGETAGLCVWVHPGLFQLGPRYQAWVFLQESKTAAAAVVCTKFQ